MKFSEAVAHYEQGKSIRKKSWLPDCHYNPNGGNIKAVDLQDAIKSDWELYDDKVEVETLKEGDLFELNSGTVYRVLPAYMLQYTHGKDTKLGLFLPVICHENGRLDFISVGSKVKKL